MGENVIRAALKAFKRGLGSADFQADIDFLNLTAGVPNSTKNNSRTTFFSLRDDAFEVVCENIKELFPSRNVTEMAATLDKVTIHHKSYTVLLTFFFYNGRIHCVLNELLIMSEEEYSGPGTATMVVRCLTETLGLSRTRLASLLTHFAMDGVYVETEQRVAGGGSLSLVSCVERELGLDERSITGTWDISHSLQLVWKNGLADSTIEELIDLIFTSMDDHRLGQAGTIFRARAANLGNLVLTNKKKQTTRFVRSLARGLQAYLRNLPTMVNVRYQAYEHAVRQNAHAMVRTILTDLSKKSAAISWPGTDIRDIL